MKKFIKSLSLTCCTLVMAGMGTLGTYIPAAAKSFTHSEIQMPLNEYNMPMSAEDAGGVCNYQIKETDGKHGKNHMKIRKYSYTNNKANNTQNIACSDDWVNYVRSSEKDKQTLVASAAKGKGKLRYTVYNRKGKKVSEVIDKFTKKEKYRNNMRMQDLLVKGNKLYSAYIKNNEYAHIRCINMKTGKVKYDTVLKTPDAFMYEMKIYGNRIYLQTKDEVNVYSLTGKKQSTYKLPEGGNTSNSSFDDISVSGDYIYFINSNGVYRCNINADQGFEVYYDAKDDAYFQQCAVYDICAVGEDKFYVMFMEKDNIEMNMPSKIVEYVGQ